MSERALFNIINYYLRLAKQDIVAMKHIESDDYFCKGTGKKSLYCYNCNLDNRCPFQRKM